MLISGALVLYVVGAMLVEQQLTEHTMLGLGVRLVWTVLWPVLALGFVLGFVVHRMRGTRSW